MRLSTRFALYLLAGLLGVILPLSVHAAVSGGSPGTESLVPEPTVLIDAYEGSLNPSSPVTGNITASSDDFDWWCLRVTSGVPLTVTIQRTSGTGAPNCGLAQGVVNAGSTFQTLGPILASTNNGSLSSATLNFTPAFTGVATIWVASPGSSFNFGYSLSMSGGQFNPDCGPTDIGVTKTVNNASPNVGGTVVYTVSATNLGPATATSLVVTDLLPAGVTYVSHTTTQGTYVPGTGLWTVGTVASPGSATLTITATVTGAPGQTITNTACRTGADQADPVPGNNCSSVSITVQSADIGMTKTVSNLTPNVGGSITYTVLASNLGPNTATSLVVTDLLPAGVTYVSHTTTQGTYVPGTGLWTVGTVASPGSATLTITATVTGAPGQTITNTACRTGADQADPVPGNNCGSVSITVQSADIGITKTVSNPTPNVGGSTTYTVLASNLGPNTATSLVVTDLLPAGVTYVSHTTTQGTYVPGTGIWTVGTVASPGSATLTITATVTGAPGQTITNTACRTGADQADPVPGNNCSSVSITVQSADIGITKTVSNPTPNVGGSITYTVLASNLGPNTATSLVVTDLLPAGVTYVSHTTTQGTYVPGTGVWTVGTVASPGSATLTITATVTGAPGQTVTNTACRTGADQADPVPGNNCSSVSITVQSADIGITKTVSNPTPNVGGSITYTVLASNLGPNTATNLIVTDQLPAGVTYVSHTTTQGTYVPGSGVWTVGTVASPGSATLTITATVNAGTAGQTITNTASRTSADQADPVPGNNTGTAIIIVGCPDVNITGAVRYFSNNVPILPNVPNAGTSAVLVRDCNNGAITSPATTGNYNLAYGDGLRAQACVCASRPKADCNLAEGGVISGNDLIMVEDWVAGVLPLPSPRQVIAADTDGDHQLLLNDRLAIAQWIGHTAVCSSNTCLGQPGDNCVGTWQFVYPTGGGPSDFLAGSRCLTNVCIDQTVDIQGILVGDADGSWPNLFPTANRAGVDSSASVPGLSAQISNRSGDVVELVLTANLESGEALHHVIYSLDYNARDFQYLGARAGSAVESWNLFDNPAQEGVCHGIVHRRGGQTPLHSTGEVLVFRFRARSPAAEPEFSFTRLRANDVDVDLSDPEHGVPRSPSVFAMGSAPNPFNPSLRVWFAIPPEAGTVQVTIRIHDIAGRVVRTLFHDAQGSGIHYTQWNGVDDRNRAVGSGIYFVHVVAGKWSKVQKVTLLK